MQKINAKAIIFDKDGTLLEFDPFWISVSQSAITKLLNKFEVSQDKKESCLTAIGLKDGVVDSDGVLCKGTYGEIAEVLFEIFNSQKTILDKKQFESECIKSFHDSIPDGVVLPTSKHLCATLKALKDRGIKLFVVTSDDQKTTEVCLKGLKIENLFEKVITDDGVHPHKPHPYYAQSIMKYYNLSESQVVMVGDTLTDTEFAKNANIKCVGLAKTEQAKSLLQGNATIVVSDLSLLTEIIG